MNKNIILLVDDNQSDLELAIRALKKSGAEHQLVVAEDGQEALDYLLGVAESGRVDPVELPALILLDINLPRMNGLEFLHQLRLEQRLRRLPVVILTSSAVEADVAACYDLGANAYIRKPVDFVEFTENIQQLVKFWLEINIRPPTVEH